ncbi:hypothetical protein [Croceimicrobium hydrocarbonivorans]|uniref:Uncharacterized protein n=1 Tax=Croceimicrobium hydrocarbonivorans TaxID=2761580 RepID=A0A7H0VB91_9FLAO|nr:hypothetical protein [Croceimicrobium hydrocarbonivorans]QNR22946.1 hypothetical protein H4K34_11210 [Croceimicrobium hydrocarbonivorans]QNR22989.1 hypothetical protein H4K34_11425 [Croceimicrobium hydrocarbonivorans]
MNAIQRMAIKSLLPLLGDGMTVAFDAFESVDLKEGEDRVMMWFWPENKTRKILVMPVTVNAKGEYLRNLWDEPKTVENALSELLKDADL